MAELKNSAISTGISPVILMPLPDHDFDPTEASIPWQACRTRGWKVMISTEHGDIPECDLNRLNGPLPGLIGAGRKAKAAYQKMTQDVSYQQPIPYAEIDLSHLDALLLPGGDGLRMRQYLENQILQGIVLQFFQHAKLVGAICHGMLVLARTIDPQSGHSVLYGHKVTAVPRSLDRFAYWMDSWLIKHGYIMYAQCVSDEVRACLEHPQDFLAGPGLLGPYVVADGNLITSRWYMDAELFAESFTEALQQRIPSRVKST